MGTEIRINLLFCRYTICNVRNVIGGQRYTSEHDKKQSLTNKIRPICSDKQKEISNDSNKNSQQYREKTIKSNNKCAQIWKNRRNNGDYDNNGFFLVPK